MGREISMTLRTSFPPQRHGSTEERGVERKKLCVSESLCTLIFTTETQRHREGIWEEKNSVSLSLCVP